MQRNEILLVEAAIDLLRIQRLLKSYSIIILVSNDHVYTDYLQIKK